MNNESGIYAKPKGRSMSFLSPRRRKTTGNLKINGQVANGRVNGDGSDAAAPTSPPVLGSPVKLERPGGMYRPASQPLVPTNTGASDGSESRSSSGGGGGGDGNLFYAYARKADDLKSRYLLTFASATVANEWWLLLQTNFPDATRPGPQLFSFKTEDLLSKAWKHPSFAHLKSRWMYISFTDAKDGIGGAAQGIIPVQDAEGNMLGGSAPASPEMREVKREAQVVKNEVHKLEDHFEKMMAAVERNTEKVAELAHNRTRSASDVISFNVDSDAGSTRDSAVDMGVLSGHFVRMNDLLSKNSKRVEELTKKHFSNETKLKETLEALDERRKEDYLGLQQLSSHLNRIQTMMEDSAKERQESSRNAGQDSQPLQVDFSPLTTHLQRVQEAVEQNSDLIRALLNEGEEKPSTPFWGKDLPVQNDFTPLTQHLERIHAAVEQQSEHMKALVGYASGETTGEGDAAAALPGANLAPLGEHLEQIYNAIEEGNRHLKQTRDLDLSPLEGHLSALREHSKKSSEHMEQLVDSSHATREAIEANGGEIDFTPLAELLDAIRESTDSNAEVARKLLESQEAERREETIVDFGPLKEHLDAVKESTDRHAEEVRSVLQSQQSSAKTDQSSTLDLTPLTDRLNRIHSTLKKEAERKDSSEGIGDSKFLMNALTSHLSKIQGVTEQNAQHVKALRERQSSSSDTMHTAVAETSEQVRMLVKRNEENEARIDAQNSQMRELMSGQREMVEVMRQLTKSIVAQNKGACDHIVVPPPRKMSKKVVGFVYDAKDGTP